MTVRKDLQAANWTHWFDAPTRDEASLAGASGSHDAIRGGRAYGISLASTTTPSWRLQRAAKTAWLIPQRMLCTEPSANSEFMPPGWAPPKRAPRRGVGFMSGGSRHQSQHGLFESLPSAEPLM